MTINFYQLSSLQAQSQNTSYVASNLTNQLKQIVHQIRLGLPVEKLLQNNLEIAAYITQLRELAPQLFNPRKQVYIDFPLTVKLEIDEYQTNWLEIPVSVGLKKDGTPLLIEWGQREAFMNWQDRVKLWATVEYWQVQPEQLKLLLFGFEQETIPTKQTFSWSAKEHQTTQEWLIKLITGEQETQPNPERFKQQIEIDIDTIEEVAI